MKFVKKLARRIGSDQRRVSLVWAFDFFGTKRGQYGGVTCSTIFHTRVCDFK